MKPTKRGVVHVVAECQDCAWGTENYQNGRRRAAYHAEQYHHKVVVDEGVVFEYDGRRKEQEKP